MSSELISLDFRQYIVYVRPQEYINGTQVVFRFPNNYGASVVRNSISYGHEAGKFELAVIRFNSTDNDDWKIVYDTPITADVLGWMTVRDIVDTLNQIISL